MSAWMDVIGRVLTRPDAPDVSAQVTSSVRRKRLLIVGGIAAGIVALVAGILIWRHYAKKKGSAKEREKKSNPSIRVRKPEAPKSKSRSRSRNKKSARSSKKGRTRKPSKKLKDTTEIQTLIFSKDRFESAAQAKEWAEEHDFKTTKVDETGQSFRLRQHVPGLYGPRSFRTITLTDGVKGVVARKKAA